MSWWGAQAWIGYLNKTSYDGYSNWALPTTVPGLSGYNQTGSQMDELFYNELGGVAGNSLNTTHNANYNLFTNVLQNSVNAPNWSGTDVLYVGNAWVFDVRNGNQGNAAKSDQFYAWAVRSGDVSAVSVPGAVWLFASGLMGLLGFKRRKVA
jgi:hypothetical protein